MERRALALTPIGLAAAVTCSGAELPAAVHIDTPMSPPVWALLERELLRANSSACREYYDRYFDDQGYLLCVERWGGDDGPDDAAEAVTDWPILHALGASESIEALYRKAWEGHLRQYTLARTTEVPLARDGMYYKEFPTQFDWLHNGEGLVAFNLHGLSNPNDPTLIQRARRYAGFYMNEDPGAPNYDPQHRLIRSMFNGSRGPLLRKATALDWAGDPIEVKNRFHLGHGEQSYEDMLLHFRDYNDVVGDVPSNLLTTNLAVNAYALTGEEKYRRWVLEYVDAWRDRMRENGDVIPSNVGPDGKIGSSAGGKWYGGVYGWGFSVYDPGSKKTVHRNQHYQSFSGFANAYLLTGDDSYLDPWRKQADKINAQGRTQEGKSSHPTMFGDQGWYEFVPGRYSVGALETYLLTMKASDRRRCAENPWIEFLDGNRPGYPEEALRADLNRVRTQIAEMHADDSTPDTRLSDDPMRFNPASVTSLVQLQCGGAGPPRTGNLLSCRLRYFDPDRRRAGLPDDVAALVPRLEAECSTVTLVNTSQVAPRTLIIQAGAFAEHRFNAVTWEKGKVPAGGPWVTVRLEPGCGAQLRLDTRLHQLQPRLTFPWNVATGTGASTPK